MKRSLLPTTALCLLAISSAALAPGCGPQNARNSSGGKCQVLEAKAPEVSERSAATPPKSRFLANLHIPQGQLAKMMVAGVPKVLASEKERPVGAPGKATYKVTRGGAQLVSKNNKLEIHVPIEADIEVCKPILNGCVKYGSCQPKFDVTFSLSPEELKGYQLAAPTATIEATKSCVIGVNVTSEILKVARQELAKVEGQIKQRWPKMKPLVKKAYKELATPLELSEGQCVAWSPEELLYLPPKMKENKAGKGPRAHLTGALGMTGTLSEVTCGETQKLPPLPDPSVKSKLPKQSRLYLPEFLSDDAVRAGLEESLSGKDEQGNTISVEDVKLGADKVHVLLTFDGELCGQSWVSGTFSHHGGDGQLRLLFDEVKPIEGRKPSPEERAAALVIGRGSIPLSGFGTLGPDATSLEERVQALLPRGVKPTFKDLKFGETEIQLTEGGVSLFYSVEGVTTMTSL